MEGKLERQEQRQAVRFKGKQTLGFPQLQLLSVSPPRSALYKIYMTHQKGHKSLFDCGTMPEKYISRHLFWRRSWETKWKYTRHVHTLSDAQILLRTTRCRQRRAMEKQSSATETHWLARRLHPVSLWSSGDVAPQCHLQSLWSKCIRIDGAFHQMLLWGTWFVYLMKPVSQWICVLAFGSGGRCWWQISLKQGHWINKSN